jgi:hypothetical protein
MVPLALEEPKMVTLLICLAAGSFGWLLVPPVAQVLQLRGPVPQEPELTGRSS